VVHNRPLTSATLERKRTSFITKNNSDGQFLLLANKNNKWINLLKKIIQKYTKLFTTVSSILNKLPRSFNKLSLFIYVFLCDLFNDADNSSEYTESNDRMINE
jgi:hypothetical protein